MAGVDDASAQGLLSVKTVSFMAADWSEPLAPKAVWMGPKSNARMSIKRFMSWHLKMNMRATPRIREEGNVFATRGDGMSVAVAEARAIRR